MSTILEKGLIMKRKSMAMMLMLAAMMIAGCSGVTLSPRYSQILDQTTAWSDAAATRAEAGQMTPDEQTRALRQNATMWAEFQNARDGRKGGEEK